MTVLTLDEKLDFCYRSYKREFDDTISFKEYESMTMAEFKYKDNGNEAETFEEYVDELYEIYSNM